MRMILITLPVADVAAAKAFYEALGFGINEPASDERTVAVMIDDEVLLRLEHRDLFANRVTGDVAAAGASPTAVHGVVATTRDEVDEYVANALANGGSAWLPARDDETSYTGSFADPDGHVWEILWMDQLHIID